MNHRTRLRREHKAAVLARMERARTQLLIANIGLRLGQYPAGPHVNALSLTNLRHALAAAPRVTLLGSAVLGTVVFGPKRVVPMLARTGLLGWVARNVRLQGR
ncbi:hypothetical protein F4827_004225 [Paraburkholderia bannensis]|uniref:Uncharacterized protein n=1 Tax=Paraburkholderia bannensis TaxID=765414 RepID=A0A7W9WUH9_9BURK|nr:MULTISPECIES: hypothetical protein [Paraburkholderia]MBB3259350.1 hypothetical protein [Paraburkholderia sp. WP4_3_2]MBB6104366.1 hypothetical protein [Paraburkholderia bannensis]